MPARRMQADTAEPAGAKPQGAEASSAAPEGARTSGAKRSDAGLRAAGPVGTAPDGARREDPARFDGGDVASRIEGIAVLSEIGLQATSSEAVFDEVAHAVNKLLRGEGAYLFLFAADKTVLRRFGPSNELSEWAVAMPAGIGRTKLLTETREPIVMDYTHPHESDRIPSGVLERGYRSAVSLPLSSGDETLGICSVAYGRRVEWPPEDLLFLKQVGRVAGALIDHVMLARKAIELSILGERKRLSSEIHENVSHLIGSLSLCSASVLASHDDGDMDGVYRGLEKMEGICSEAMRVFRDEMLSLRVPSEGVDEWIEAVEGILENFQSEWGIETTLRQKIVNEPLSFTAQVSMHLTRILNECLSNTLKHAQATSVVVSLYETGTKFGMTIADDGHGFDVDAVAPGRLGIKIMRERTEAMGGRLSIRSNAHGTVVKVDVPRVGKL